MRSVAIDIRDYLAGVSALGLVIGETLHASEIPDRPAGGVGDLAVGILDGPGYPPETAGVVLDRPTFQVAIRGSRGEYGEAYALAEAIKRELHGRHDVTVGATRYIGIFAEGDIFPLGQDEARRPRLTVNFRALRTG